MLSEEEIQHYTKSKTFDEVYAVGEQAVSNLMQYGATTWYTWRIFCVCPEPMQDGGSGKYIGLGYSFDIEGNFVTEAEYRGVTKWTYRLFGIELQTQIRD